MNMGYILTSTIVLTFLVVLITTETSESRTFINKAKVEGTFQNGRVNKELFVCPEEKHNTSEISARENITLMNTDDNNTYIRLETDFRSKDGDEYIQYNVWATAFYFEVRSHNGVMVVLTTTQDANHTYEIILGETNEKGDSRSIIRKLETNTVENLVNWTDTSGILSPDEFRGIWVQLDTDQSEIQVGKHGESNPFLSGVDSNMDVVTNVGFSVIKHETAHWRLLRDCFGSEPHCSEEDISIINGYTGGSCGICRDGVAPPVTNLTVKNIASSGVVVSWETTWKDRVNITHYELSYEHEQFIACESDMNDPYSRGRRTTAYTLELIPNLRPYSLYTVSVRGVAKDGGVITTTTFTTASAAPEISPKAESTQVASTVLWFHWSIPDTCSKRNGHFQDFYYQLYGESPWVKGLQEESTTLHPAVYALQLVPFSRYRLRVYIRNCDNLMNLQEYVEMSADTKESAPPAPKILALNYSSSGSPVFRWESPYPPHGKLRYYILSYRSIGDEAWHNMTVEHVCTPGDAPCVFSLGESMEHMLSNETVEEVKVMACNERDVCGKWSKTARGRMLNRSGGIFWSKASENPADTGVIVGVVCGSLAGVAILGLLGFIMYRNRRASLRNRRHYYAVPSKDRHDAICMELSDVSPMKISAKLFASRNVAIPPPVRPSPTVPLLPMKRLSRRVEVPDLQNYVYTAIISRELQKQHVLLPRGHTKSCEYGRQPELKSRNRYGAIFPYDDSRVILDVIEGEPFSDYINASYVDGYEKPKAFIATQGPKQNTIVDLWRMIWQENVAVVVMLTNLLEKGLRKCEQYWPESGEQQYGDFQVLLLSCTTYADYTLRQLQVTKETSQRQVTQIHFTSWPDHGVPSHPQSVGGFSKKLLSLPTGTGPVVVHCSAGVGRTGTIILIDTMLRMAAVEGAVDILGHFQTIRAQRMNLVDSYDQYKFVHMVLVEVLLGEHLTIPCRELDKTIQKMREVDPDEDLSDMQRQFKRLEYEKEAQESGITTTVNNNILKKIREHVLPPGDHCRVHLLPSIELDYDYINAAFVNGFRSNSEYICTQLPLEETVCDFWRMVQEFGVQTIVVLHELVTQEVEPPFFISVDDCSEKLTQMEVTVITETHTGAICHRTLQLKNTQKTGEGEKSEESCTVTMLQLTGWSPAEDIPQQQAMLDLISQVEPLRTQTTGKAVREAPVVVVCLDGVSGCGLFLVLSIICDEIRIENTVDVYQAVRTIRRSRPQFVQNLEQYEFCYDVAGAYLKK